MARRYHANNVSTTLATAIGTSSTTVVVASATGMPTLAASETFRITVVSESKREIMEVTARSGTSLTVTRAQESTTAQVFPVGALIELRATANSIDRKADGAASSTDKALARYDGTSGLILQNSGAVVDDNGNLSVTNYSGGYTTTASSGGTLTLTVASNRNQYITGTTTHTITLPVVSTLPNTGYTYYIVNNSTGSVTVNSSGGNLVQTLTAGTAARIQCILLTGTTAASWNSTYHSGGLPFGSNTHVQYNNSGAFGGNSGFTYDGSGGASLSASLQIGGNSTAAGYIRLLEDSDNGSNYTGWAAPASLAGNIVYTMPTADGTTGQVLRTDGAGVLSWVSPAAATLSGTMAGDIDVGGYSFISSSNGNIKLVPNGTGAVLIGGNSTQPCQLRLMEDSDNGTNYTGFVAPSSLAGNIVYELPGADGSANQVLKTNGSGVLSWTTASGGALTFITSATASSSATLDFTGLGDYSKIVFVLNDIKPVNDAVALFMRTSTNNGSTYDSGAGNYTYAGYYFPSTGSAAAIQSTSDTSMRIISNVTVGNSTAERVSGTIEMFNPSGADYVLIGGNVYFFNASTQLHSVIFSGSRVAAQDTDAVRFLFSSGNIASGTIYVYGQSKT